MGSVRTWRLALAALVVPALVLAALAARSHSPFAGAGAGERGASNAFVDTVFTLSAVLLVSLLVILFWTRVRVPRRAAGQAPARLSLGAFLLYLAVLAAAVAVFRHGLQQEPPVPEGEEGADPAFPTITVPERPVDPTTDAARAPRFVWPLAGGVAALVAAAIVIAVLAHRRRSSQGGPTLEELERVALALDEAIDDLRTEPDPRRAVVAAYARMEQALLVLGLPRRPAEAPQEYLVRVGRGLDAETSVAALTELFELAKFSDHGIDEPMRARAIEALVAVRDEVRRA